MSQLSSCLPQAERESLRSLSKGFKKNIEDNDDAILDSLHKKYGTDSIHDMIENIILAENMQDLDKILVEYSRHLYMDWNNLYNLIIDLGLGRYIYYKLASKSDGRDIKLGLNTKTKGYQVKGLYFVVYGTPLNTPIRVAYTLIYINPDSRNEVAKFLEYIDQNELTYIAPYPGDEWANQVPQVENDILYLDLVYKLMQMGDPLILLIDEEHRRQAKEVIGNGF